MQKYKSIWTYHHISLTFLKNDYLTMLFLFMRMTYTEVLFHIEPFACLYTMT